MDFAHYYGNNLDALWDQLTQLEEFEIKLINSKYLVLNLRKYGEDLIELFDDLKNESDKYKISFYWGVNMIKKLEELMPKISGDVWVADNAIVVGDVEMMEDSSVWYSASVRGDEGKIKIGKGSNIQDNSVLHNHVTIGEYSTIGHNVILHGCTIGNNVVIGMGAIILDGAKIGDNSIIGAGTLVTANKEIPANSLAFGNPAKIVRQVTDEEINRNMHNSKEYIQKSKRHQNKLKDIE